MGTQIPKKVPMGTRVPKWGPIGEQCLRGTSVNVYAVLEPAPRVLFNSHHRSDLKPFIVPPIAGAPLEGKYGFGLFIPGLTLMASASGYEHYDTNTI